MLAKLYPNPPWRRPRSAPPLDAQPFAPTARRTSLVPDASNLGELNACLSVLVDIFPDVRPEVFREMLTTFSEVSRLQLVTESLLKNKEQYVQGRWNVAKPGEKSQRQGQDNVPPQQRFRNQEYLAAVKAALSEEFRGFSRSSLKAVLAEHNYSYTETRQALLTLSSQSWRFSLAKVLLRRKAPSADQHPLIEWRTIKDGSRAPSLISTGCAELDVELKAAHIEPFLKRKVEDQVNNDRQIAEKLNEAEAEQAEALFDCECCFIPNTFEIITVCDKSGHYICSTCVRHTITEAVYGQGWARSVNTDRGLLKCVAPGSASESECVGCITQDDVRRALTAEPTKDDTLAKFEQRLATESLTKSQIQLSKCPFCAYAEFEDIAATSTPEKIRSDYLALIAVVILTLCLLDVLLDITKYKLILITTLAVLITSYRHLLPTSITTTPHPPTKLPQPHFGRKFICRNPSCRQTSCLSCSALWTDIHICHQSSRLALRTFIESAVTDAIKRTCPQCNIAFVKSSGCNKLVCVCGYAMCYVCRADIGKEGYLHFCQHFRPDGGEGCRECEKCDLYRVEDEEVVIRRAREAAEREWRERERLVQGDAQRIGGLSLVDEEVSFGRKSVRRQGSSR